MLCVQNSRFPFSLVGLDDSDSSGIEEVQPIRALVSSVSSDTFVHADLPTVNAVKKLCCFQHHCNVITSTRRLGFMWVECLITLNGLFVTLQSN